MFISDFYNKKNIAEGFGDTVGDTVQKLATKVGDKLANALPKDMQPFNNDTAAKTYASLKPVKEPVKEQQQSVSDYNTWRDQIDAQGGEIHPQRDRVRMVAQSWDGETMGEFNLRTGQGWINGQQGVTENTTPDDEKVIELFAQIVADDTGYSVKKVNYEIYDEGLRTPSGIPVYFYSFDGDVRYIGALPGGKPTAIVNQDGEVGSRGSHLELSIGGQVEYVIKGKTLFSAADQQQIAKAKPGGDEYSLVMIALDLMWGRMQHKFMEQGVAEATGDEKFDTMIGKIASEPKVPDMHSDMPPTSIPELLQWAKENNKPYHYKFAEWARKHNFTNVNAALMWFGDNVDPWDEFGPKDHLNVFGDLVGEPLIDAAKHNPKAAELLKVFACYEKIYDDWTDEYRQMKEQGVAEGADDIAQAKERLAYLEKIFDTSYEYSDDHSVWKKHNAIRQEMDQLKKIIGQSVDEGSELPPNVIAMIKKIAQSSAAPDHKKAMINALIAKYSNSGVAETYGAELHTKHKRNRFKQIKKIKQTQDKAFGLSEAGCTMTEAGRECPVHGMNECPGYEMTETSAQDKLHQRHQEIRKKSGLPHPDHYLKMMKQKQAEIDALKADIAADQAKGLGEARKPDYNFDIEDIKKLERIRDLPTLKTLAFDLISKPSAKPMKPEKVEWFRSALERMDSPLKVIKLMYDLMLSGEGHQVIGSRNSMKANSYRGRFSEQDIEEGLRDPKDNPCWDGYKPVGTKKKAGKTVPNCVPTNEDIERYVEALSLAGYDLQEEKTRLDPKCWKGKKIGNPKTKMKGGVRVNNCVPK